MSTEGQLLAGLALVPTCSAMDILKDDSPERLVMRQVRPFAGVTRPVAGRARTLRFLPLRSDVPISPNGKVNFDLIDSIQPGDFMVVDAPDSHGGSVLGDMLALRAKQNGAVAVATDGCMRDIQGMEEVGLPVFSRSTWPIPSAATLIPWESDVPIQCGGALVLPGDYILADRDAVLVLPEALARKVSGSITAVLAEEAFCRRLLERGHALRHAFPMPKPLRPLFEQFLVDGILPDAAAVIRASS